MRSSHLNIALALSVMLFLAGVVSPALADEESNSMVPEQQSSIQNPVRGNVQARAQETESETSEQTGVGVVTGVDQPDNCLRIRRGPSASSEQIGCADKGDELRLNGTFSKDGRWAQLDNNGWVFLAQIKTDMKPPAAQTASRSRGFVNRSSEPSQDFEEEWEETPATSSGDLGEWESDENVIVDPDWEGSYVPERTWGWSGPAGRGWYGPARPGWGGFHGGRFFGGWR
jgi:hypothetical protein